MTGTNPSRQPTQALLVVDAQGRILTLNREATTLFGYERKELLRQPIEILIPEQYRAAHPGHRAEYFAHACWRPMADGRDIRARRKDGTTFPVEIKLAPLQLRHGTQVMVAVRDVSERFRLIVAAQEAQARAERANRAKDDFLSVLSHELRTPLTPILVWTRLLRTRQLDAATVAHGLEAIEQSARAQLRLVEDLLDVSRILSGKLHMEFQTVDMAAVIQQALTTIETNATAKRIRLRSECEAVSAWGDPQRLEQVTWNLLANAVKFSPEDSTITIRLRPVQGDAELVVIDEGKGIRAEFLPHIFERFRQQDSSSTRAQGGLGLGLAIVHHLVTQHGGTVRAESPGEGQGATFTVRLPLVTTRSVRQLRHPVPVNLASLRILLVEDDAGTAQALSTCLRESGATAIVARSAAEALTILERHVVDVLLADIGLPGEDGYSLVRRIRVAEIQARKPPLPALALTAHARPEDRRQALAAGFQAHLTKPIDPIVLFQEISKVSAARGRSDR